MRTLADQGAGSVIRGRIGDKTARGEVDGGNVGAGEGEQQVGGAGAGDLEDVARAVVEHGPDAAEIRAAGIIDGEADQVGVVIFVRARRRQAVARGVETGGFEGFRRLAGGDAGQAGGEGALERLEQG